MSHVPELNLIKQTINLRLAINNRLDTAITLTELRAALETSIAELDSVLVANQSVDSGIIGNEWIDYDQPGPGPKTERPTPLVVNLNDTDWIDYE